MTEKNIKILLVDDETDYLDVIELILGSAGYQVDTAQSGRLALEKLKKKDYDLVLTDLIMPSMTGVELLEIIRQDYLDTEVIIFTGYGSVKSAVEAMKKGAFSYFIKSHDPEELISEINKIEVLHTYLKNTVKTNFDFMYDTKSASFQKVLKTLEKAAQTDVNILLLGESGVGKEILANHIHSSSQRLSEPFIPVNCHSFSENLLESELFGHEKGSFTGANETRIGRFEASHGGTLFLDEIGDTSQNTQVKLLRTLESKVIERIGSNQKHEIDFRLICATNRNLSEMIQNGDFREDLYYRISTIAVTIPALRDRKEDLPLLINYFMNEIQEKMKVEIKLIDDAVINALLQYDYPGNIRELKNIIERLVVLSSGGHITTEDLPEHFLVQDVSNDSLKSYRDQSEKVYIIKALEQNSYHMTHTAEQLGISRRQLFNKIEKYHIEK